MSQRPSVPKPSERAQEPSQSPAEGARGRLEAVGLEAFARAGFHGTTTRDIAGRTGMSPAALYVHYSSKEELLYTLSLAGHRRALQVTMDVLATDDDPAAQLWAFMHAYVLHHLRNTTEARVLNYELGALSPEHLKEISQLRRQVQHQVRRLIERGQADGAFHTPNASMSTVVLLSLCIDLARWYRPDGEWSAEQIANYYSDLGLRIVGAGTPLTGPART